MGVTVPEAIFSPEPSFSDEARKVKGQGIVLLMIVVGKDGQPYDHTDRAKPGDGIRRKSH